MINRRKWLWLDWVIYSLYSIWFLMGIAFYLGKPDELGSPSTISFLIIFSFCFGLPLLFWRPRFIHSLYFPISILLTTGLLNLYLIYRFESHTGLMLIPILIIAYLSHRRTIIWWIVIFVLLYPALDLLLSPEINYTNELNAFVNTIVMFGIGYILNLILHSNLRMKQLLAENERQKQLIEEQNASLKQYAKQIERLTVIEERNRMARELHDTIGHTFTSVIMGMDAVSYLMKLDPDVALTKLDVLRDVTRKGLDEVRSSIHQIPSKEVDELLSYQVKRMSNEFALHTNTEVICELIGEEYEIPRQSKLILIRCLQEALTNAKRHGDARQIVVTVQYEPECLRLEIRDNGIGFDELSLGFGLTAMQERVTAIQGTLQVSSKHHQGVSIACRIPRRGNGREAN